MYNAYPIEVRGWLAVHKWSRNAEALYRSERVIFVLYSPEMVLLMLLLWLLLMLLLGVVPVHPSGPQA